MDTVSISRCIGSGIKSKSLLNLPFLWPACCTSLGALMVRSTSWTFGSTGCGWVSEVLEFKHGIRWHWSSPSMIFKQGFAGPGSWNKGDYITRKNVGLYEIVMFYDIERLLFVGYSHWSLIESMFIVSSTLLPHCIFGPVRMFSPCHQQDKQIYINIPYTSYNEHIKTSR